MNGAFASQILSEKLSKLNSSQQSIETLSHWCIFHRKNAKQVVETWERDFFTSPKEQRVPFLFLANDILQNSRRKGGEFVNEFWKVLSSPLRDVLSVGEENVRSTVFRLIEIWEERKVFGSRVHSLREELLGYDFLDTYGNYDKPANVAIKVPKDASPEKIAAAYHALQEHLEEEELTFEKCHAAVGRIGEIQKETDLHDGHVNPPYFKELQQLRMVLSHCIEQFEASEMIHLSLVSKLKEALHDQEIRLDQIHAQVEIAQAHAEQVAGLQQHLLIGNGEVTSLPQEQFQNNSRQENNLDHQEYHPGMVNDGFPSNTRDPLTASEPSIDNLGSLDDENSAAAAEVAAKLAASTSSAQMLSSILSSLAAEGIRPSYHNGLATQSSPVDISSLPQEKRQRLDGATDVYPHMDPNQSYAPHRISQLSQQSTSARPPPTMMPHMPPIPPRSAAVQHQILPPPFPPFMGTSMPGNHYEYSGGMPPHQAHPVLGLSHTSMMMHQPLPPGCSLGSYMPLQSSDMGFYSQPPLPPPPAPLPRQ